MLYSQGLSTIRDVANADMLTTLRLRGYDLPSVPLDQRLDFHRICDVKKLCQELVKKCTPDLTYKYYAGYDQMPGIIIPKFSGKKDQLDYNKYIFHRVYKFMRLRSIM